MGSRLPTGDPELVSNDNSDASLTMIELPICFSGNELTIDGESEAKQWVPAQAAPSLVRELNLANSRFPGDT
ncbi:hypothetical protein V502_03681 [Pseudogymnoascus sp. VKM F-4520 (FW-2644)]|nr:hypothetical protein V502_03681 [Pseudogymnoascus sp. VKM F-4520 (FW-2644)]